MQNPFSLITEKWLAVRRERKTLDWISPAEITSITEYGEVVDFAWGRPDFDLASHEFMIGLLTIALPSKSRDRDWENFYRKPPTPDQLASHFAPFADKFFIDGPGPCFLQELNNFDGDHTPVDELLLDVPGGRDLFVKHGLVATMSRPAAAISLYTLQQFASGGGRGYRTSIRRGGPLVTLATESSGEKAIWNRLWLNVPARHIDNLIPSLVFPWTVATITSENGEVIHESEENFPQAFFGMPRRIRLIFLPNEERRACDLTGTVDNFVCATFYAKPNGSNYGSWRHPLTPYRHDGEDAKTVLTPVSRVGYRNWLGLVYATSGINSIIPARCITDARNRLLDLRIQYPLIRIGGYAMKNAKALAFADSTMPMHVVHNDDIALRCEIERAFSNLATQFVEGARVAETILAIGLRRALQGERGNAAKDSSLLEAPRERLWDITERDFHDLLDKTIAKLPLDIDDERGVRFELRQFWRHRILVATLKIFDETAPIDMCDVHDPKDIVEGRKLLTSSLNGYGKLGASFFKALGLPLPELVAKAKKKKETGA